MKTIKSLVSLPEKLFSFQTVWLSDTYLVRTYPKTELIKDWISEIGISDVYYMYNKYPKMGCPKAGFVPNPYLPGVLFLGKN